MEINKAWAENAFVTKANLMHERVHDAKTYTQRGKKAFCGINIYNDEADYGIYGVCDLIEGSEDLNGTCIDQYGKRYNLTIIEYKPTKPKGKEFNHDDSMQVFAQKICVDRIFSTDAAALIYYADVKQRVSLPFKEKYTEYDAELKSIIKKMRDCVEQAYIPPISKGQKCSGCSLKDLCMPSVKKYENIRELIKKYGDRL